LARDPAAVRALVDQLSPIIERRVAAALWRRTSTRDVRQELADMTQEVFLSLFAADGKALRAWDPARGLSLDKFVGMLAQHQVASILRNGRTSPWRDDPTEADQIDRLVGPTAGLDAVVGSREHLRALLDRLRASLSPRGLELFQRLIVDEEPVEVLCVATGMTREALYQWRSRLLRQVRELSAQIQAEPASDPAGPLRIVNRLPKS
jgi:RNA polymerase sigma-70 factor (ECF subfamily)